MTRVRPLMRVQLLNVGWLTAPASLMRRGEPDGALVRLPVPAYLIETEAERILVDTGLHPDAVADASGYYGESAALDLFGFEQERHIAEQVDLDTVTMVVLTHLHWDHAGGLPLVPASVPLVIQSREWAAGHDKGAVRRNFLFPRDYAGEERPLVLVEGDHDLLGDGSIELLLTPGHTPGHQSVRAGDLVIGADVAHFAGGLDDRRFPAFGDDHEEQGRSADRLRELRDAGLTVMPGHDPDVLRPGPLQ
ncbi:MAG TPA: N-acyl homoserine lactonase family protein [Thermoanaerobaculia bacterium]|nr:N-acyl homoserine lactonase family protein [Thermoanaerobaculia bacterium]